MKSNITRLRVPILDIDQNLTTKDIPFLMEKWGKVETFVSVDWREKLAEWYNRVDWSQEKSFVYGRDTGPDGDNTFPMYIQGVLDEKAFWPSFPIFKKTVIQANPFWKNTSRGHDICNIIKWTKILILWSLSAGEQEQMHESILKHGWNTKTSLIDALDDYLWQQIYAPIHNHAFMKKYDIDYNMPYNDKKWVVMKYIIEHVSDIYQKYFLKTHKGISIWFSDDDKFNIESVNKRGLEHRDWLHDENIHFTTYHTSIHQITKKKLTDMQKMNNIK